MKLYHGSTVIVSKPLYGHGKPYNDYGQGFYCTEDPELARIYREMQSLFADISIYIGKEDHSLWAEFS